MSNSRLLHLLKYQILQDMGQRERGHCSPIIRVKNLLYSASGDRNAIFIEQSSNPSQQPNQPLTTENPYNLAGLIAKDSNHELDQQKHSENLLASNTDAVENPSYGATVSGIAQTTMVANDLYNNKANKEDGQITVEDNSL